jgi:hypothetical protein
MKRTLDQYSGVLSFSPIRAVRAPALQQRPHPFLPPGAVLRHESGARFVEVSRRSRFCRSAEEGRSRASAAYFSVQTRVTIGNAVIALVALNSSAVS